MSRAQLLLRRLAQRYSPIESSSDDERPVSLQLRPGRTVSLEEQERVTLLVMSQSLSYDAGEIVLRAFKEAADPGIFSAALQIALHDDGRQRYLIAVVRVPTDDLNESILERWIDNLSAWYGRVLGD